MTTKKAKLPANPTESNLTIVFMGKIKSVDEAEINKAVKAIEKAAKKHVPDLEMDVAHHPIVERPPMTDEQKKAFVAHVEKEVAKMAKEKPVILGAATRIQDATAKAASSFFS